jgi:predicted dehydrogenase
MASRSDPVRIGIVGCGEVADEKHLRVLAAISEARLVAVADIDEQRLRRVANRHGIRHCYPDVASLLRHPGLEAVGVCVPAFAHADVAVPAIQAGKHIYLEKPMALAPEDTERILQTAEGRTERFLMGFHMRWHRLIQETRRRAEAGEIGTLESIRTVWYSPREDETLPGWRSRRAGGGGSLIEIGSHCFDLWRHLTSSEVECVYAVARSGSRDDEAAAVTARMKNGILVSGVLSERTSHEIEVELCGSRGRIRVGCQRFDGLDLFPLGSAPGQAGARIRGLQRFVKSLPGGVSGMSKGGDYLDSYKQVWRHFCRIVRTGEAPGCTLEDGRRALAIALAAAESAERGAPVAV